MNNRRLLFLGFTLVEMLVVVSVIGILAAVVVNDLRNSAGSSGRDLTILSERDQVRAALQIYYFDHGGYPYVSPDKTLTCVGSSSCYLANPNGYPAITTKLSASTALSALSVGTMPVINDSNGKEQGFVYLSCLNSSTTKDADGTVVCPSGTSYLTFPLNKTQGITGEACQIVGVWNNPVAYSATSCAPGVINGGSGSSANGSGAANNALQAVTCSGSGSLNDNGSGGQQVIWNVTKPINSGYSYVWTNTQSNLTSGSCSPNTYNCQQFTETLSAAEVDSQASSGQYQTALTVRDENGNPVGSGNCSVPIVAPTLNGTCSVSPSSPQEGNTVTWTVSPTGGRGNYGISWTDGWGFSGVGSTWPVKYNQAGTVSANVKISSNGQTTTLNNCASVTVSQPNNGGGTGGSGNPGGGTGGPGGGTGGPGGGGTCDSTCTNGTCSGYGSISYCSDYYCSQYCTYYSNNYSNNNSDNYSNSNNYSDSYSNTYCCDQACAGYGSFYYCVSYHEGCCQ